MPVTKKDREFTAFGIKRSSGVVYWIDTGAVTDALTLDQKKVLPYQAERTAKYREECEADAVAASNSEEMKSQLERKIKQDVQVDLGGDVLHLIDELRERVVKKMRNT